MMLGWNYCGPLRVGITTSTTAISASGIEDLARLVA
jgi:hypothetical protein